MALRGINNNPTLHGKEKRPIVEFAVENVHKVKQKLDNLSKRAADRLERKTEEDNNNLLRSNPPKRLKRKENKEKRENNTPDSNSISEQFSGKRKERPENSEPKSEKKSTGAHAKRLASRGEPMKDSKSAGLTKAESAGARSAQLRQDLLMDKLAEGSIGNGQQTRKQKKLAQGAPQKKIEGALDEMLHKAHTKLRT